MMFYLRQPELMMMKVSDKTIPIPEVKGRRLLFSKRLRILGVVKMFR